MDVTLSQRLQKLPPYLFADLRRKMAAAREKGVKVITLGIGDPDSPAPDAVVAELIRAVADKTDINRHRYGCDAPAEEFPAAVKSFYSRRWGVTLSDDQIVTTMGSKDAIAKLPLAIMDPGDIGIAPEPGYPTYNIGHVFAGGSTYYTPLKKENDFLIDFDSIPADVREKAKIIWMNYPNNPTTATATLDFFAKAVEFGRQNNILIAHDSAYSENVYDGYVSPSIMQIEGAADVAVEFFSLSKAFSMTGWRLGYAAGPRELIKAMDMIQGQQTSGACSITQWAALEALTGPQDYIHESNKIFEERRDLVVSMLNQASGLHCPKPDGAFYVFPSCAELIGKKTKDGKVIENDEDFVTALLEQEGVAVVHGAAFGLGPNFRISYATGTEALTEACQRIQKFCASLT